MAGILILGAGGHGKVVADILRQQGRPAVGFLDDAPGLWGTICLGLPIWGPVRDVPQYEPEGLIFGIGSNKFRKQIVETLGDAAQALWINAIHPRATVADSVRLGKGIVVAAGAVINPDAILGNHLIVNTSATIDHDCIIGDYAHIAPGAHLAGGIQIDEGAFLGIGTSVIPNVKVG